MKSIIPVVIVGFLAAGAGAQLCGDCNGDLQVTILDALVAAQHAAALVVLTGQDFTNCNVLGLLEPDPAAAVGILDALTLAQEAAGLPITLMCARQPMSGPPTVAIIAPVSGSLRAAITLLFDTSDPDADPLDLYFYASTDSGLSFFAATSAGTGSVTVNPALGTAPTVMQTFVWDSVADTVGTAGPQAVLFRIVADDGTATGEDTVGFDVDNRPAPPPSCAQVSAPPPGALACNCALRFPPAAGIPCGIDERGSPYFVNSASGSDANPGTAPGLAWATLCHAVSSVPPGSTVRVAQGVYLDDMVTVDTDILVKGGFDSTFTSWDPDLYPAVWHGRLTLNHNSATWGGFRMITEATISGNVYWHNLTRGVFVRNYVQAIFRSISGSYSVYGLVMQTPVGGRIELRCNDVYMRNEMTSGTFRAVRHYVFSGDSVLDSNRICAERLTSGGVYTIAGYGPCSASPASITLTNNVVENGTSGQYAMSLYGCGDSDLNITLTNNTFLSRGYGIHGYGGSSGTNFMRWRLTNNVVFSPGGGSTAINVATSGGAAVEIATSEHNLTFGFGDNGIYPAPIVSSGDDTTGASTPASVFVAPLAGDFHLTPTGAATGQGLNVYGLPLHGDVTQDLDQLLRAVMGSWDRGALRF